MTDHDRDKVSNRVTILRMRYEKALAQRVAAEAVYQVKKKASEDAWTIYRDAAKADGWCPFCKPATPIDKCSGHAFYAKENEP